MLSRMAEHRNLPRSPELMSRGDSALLVVDIQEKLIVAIADGPRIVWNVAAADRRGQDSRPARRRHRAVSAGPGPTVGELAERLGPVPSKLSFSCGGCPELFDDLCGPRHP